MGETKKIVSVGKDETGKEKLLNWIEYKFIIATANEPNSFITRMREGEKSGGIEREKAKTKTNKSHRNENQSMRSKKPKRWNIQWKLVTITRSIYTLSYCCVPKHKERVNAYTHRNNPIIHKNYDIFMIISIHMVNGSSIIHCIRL